MIDLKLRERITSTASEDFKYNRIDGARYIDKTPLLAALLDRDHETTFFLRPRRFGKTLTLSMIRYYAEDTRDEGLNEENESLWIGGYRVNENDWQWVTGERWDYTNWREGEPNNIPQQTAIVKESLEWVRDCPSYNQMKVLPYEYRHNV